MEISFDPKKDEINVSKHGMSLSSARYIDWGSAMIWLDQRKDYGELRHSGIGYIGIRLYVVVFVERESERRIISLRKANQRELKLYAKT